MTPNEAEADTTIPFHDPANAVSFGCPLEVSRSDGLIQFTIVAVLSAERFTVQDVMQGRIRIACRVHRHISTAPFIAEAFATTEAETERSVRCHFKVKLSALRSGRALILNVGVVLPDHPDKAEWSAPGAWFVVAASSFDVFEDYFTHFNADRG